jgi:excinuclease ABC subunit B
MQRAIEETDRRRDIQRAYNLKHGLIPTQMNKPITDIMDVGDGSSDSKVKLRLVAESSKKYNSLSTPQLLQKITELEKVMFKAAKDLDFEKAANLRDDIEAYRAQIVKNS